MKLAIISHTEHYLKDGQVVGWGPTIREINYLTTLFDEIYHVAVLHDKIAPASALPYTSDRVHFVPIKPSGGLGWRDKLGVLAQMPATIKVVQEVLEKVDYFQFRAPTGIGVFLIPYLTWFSRKQGWFKYAGNWGQANPPLGYQFQRFFLTRFQKRSVTINGRWPDQPAHCLSFANPCLDEAEREIGTACIQTKDYTQALNLCFVGRLETAKGIDRLMDALRNLDLHRIGSLHIIGDGPLRAEVEATAAELSIKVKLYGSLGRGDVGRVMEACHALILPSKAEGFPKVIAEGANYGCIPIVSDISGIAQYVRHGQNGFLLSPERLENGLLQEDLQAILSQDNLKSLAETAHAMASYFTFARYGERISVEILG